jgi:hypothetical protein
MVDTEFDSSGDASTLTIGLQTDSASAFNVAAKTIYSTAAIAQASLAAGDAPVCTRLPKGMGRYARINYTCSAAFTAGKLNAFLTPTPDAAWVKGKGTGL